MQQKNCWEKFCAITLTSGRIKQWFLMRSPYTWVDPRNKSSPYIVISLLIILYVISMTSDSLILLFYRYIHTSNLGLRLECCLLSATFFKVREALSSLFYLLDFCLHFHDVFNSFQALFCSSLPHPTADKDYALYEVGAGCEVAELIPGIDLLSDAFRSNGRSVLAALRWITEELARARYLITVRELLRKKDFFKTGGAVVLSQVVITLCFGARGLGSNSDLVTVFQLWYGWPLGKIDEMTMRRGGGRWSCNLPSITYLSWRCANIPSYLSYSLQLLWGNRDKLWQLFESFSFAFKEMLFTFFEVCRYINWMLFCF